VTDFGIARSLESDGLTKTGRVLGTTDYVAPEQAMGQAVDARCDIYSLGVLLYEMLTGEVPFQADTLVGVAMKHVNEEMPDVQKRRPEISSALAAVIERATAKEPKKRYADMTAQLADLEGALEVEVARGGAAHGQATNVLDAMPARRKLLTPRRASTAGVLLVLAAVAAALLIAALTGSDEPGTGDGNAPAGGPIEVRAAQDFDPEGTPPGLEHPDEVQNAIDGDPTTAWPTETYTASPSLPDDGKSGVGLIVDAGKPVTAHTVTLRSEDGGWAAEIYGTAAATAPDTIDGWGPSLGGADDVSTDQTVELTATKPSRYYLIWITQLSPAGGPGDYKVELDEVSLNS
jgi:eukaryotic-like serine/threonine-protein kinase